MLLMKYSGDSETYPVNFKIITDHIIELTGAFPVKTDRFTLSREGHEDNWDYSQYTTIYREIDGGIQLSNDKSVYVEPEELQIIAPTQYIPTEEELEAMEQQRLKAAATPTNAELSEALMELAESISDIEDAVAELGSMI